MYCAAECGVCLRGSRVEHTDSADDSASAVAVAVLHTLLSDYPRTVDDIMSYANTCNSSDTGCFFVSELCTTVLSFD